MAVCEFHLSANNALGKMTSLMAIVPDDAPGPCAVLYLLHGLSDDHTSWTRRTSIERHIGGLPLIVVMPNGERGFYTNSQADPQAAYETNLVHDIVGFVDRTFRTIPTREGRVIAGLSMGGYGAAKLALKYPDIFCAGVSHSGAVAFAHRLMHQEWTGFDWLVGLFGDNPTGGPDDIFALADRSDPATRPALRIDCGTEDFLLDQNRALHAHLDALGYLHEYAEHPGGHGWDYWDTHIQDTLQFFTQILNMQQENCIAER